MTWLPRTFWIVAFPALACAWSAEARADEPTQAPTAYQPDRYPPEGTTTSLLLAGGGVALGGYAMAFGTSYLFSQAPTAHDLRIPVAGPVLAVAGAGCGSSEADCGTLVVVVRTVFATLAGIGQLGGLALMAEGLFLPSPSNASGSNPYDSNRGETAHNVQQLRLDSKPSPQWFFSPVASESSFGLSVAGQF